MERGVFLLESEIPDLFSRVLFSFSPPFLATPLPPLFLAPFHPFLPTKIALFCRARDTAQSLERGSLGVDLSQNVREGNSFPKSA